MPTPHAIRNLLSQDLHRTLGAHQQSAAQTTTNLATATFPPLVKSLKTGNKQNKKQAARLAEVLRSFDLPATEFHDPDMQGISDANNFRISQSFDPVERDLIHLNYGQFAAHFYIARYGTLRAYARELGNKKAVKLLTQTIEEFSALDSKLTVLARARIVAARTSAHTTGSSPSNSGGSGLLPTTIALAGLVGLGFAITRSSTESEAQPNKAAAPGAHPAHTS